MRSPLTAHLRPSRRFMSGVAILYITIIVTVLIGFVSLAIDWGHVQLAKKELQTAADAAALAGANVIWNGTAAARDAALAVAAANRCDSTSVILNPASDIEYGKWDWKNSQFTVVTGSQLPSASAVRVTTQRTISLLFARIIGKNICDIHVRATATKAGYSGTGFVGINKVNMQNLCTLAAYNSNFGPPGGSNLNDNATLASNGPITIKNNNLFQCSAILGPNGSFAQAKSIITGNVITLPVDLIYPPVDPGIAATSNNNLNIGKTNKGRSPLDSQQRFSLSNGEKITIPAGTYYFNSLSMSNNSVINFSGPVTLYLNGPTNLAPNATINTYLDKPGNLRIRISGSTTFDTKNGQYLSADIYAPETDFYPSNNLVLRGALIARSIDVGHNIAFFYYDENLRTDLGGGVLLVQ